MASKNLSPAKLRQLIFKFYNDNDPAKVQMGLDINGIVEWTMRNGIDSLNSMLYKNFGKTINVEESLGNARDNFQRVSVGLTFSTKVMKEEHEVRLKLYNFFSRYDKSLTEAGQEVQFEKFVKFAMLNGMDKLNAKLQETYGANVDVASMPSMMPPSRNKPAGSFLSERMVSTARPGQNLFGLDRNRLKRDLTKFYVDMDDDGQLEVIDDITEWACQIGMEEFDNKTEQMYGVSLNKYLADNNLPLHKNAAAVTKLKTSTEAGEEESDFTESEEESDVQESFAGNAGTVSMALTNDESGLDFKDMSDDELKEELTLFYSTHDPDNLSRLDQVVQLARKLGRQQLNAKLMNIYRAPLKPIITKRGFQHPPGLGLTMKLSPSQDKSPPPMPPRKTNNFASFNARNTVFTAVEDNNDDLDSFKIKPPIPKPYSTKPVFNSPREEQNESINGSVEVGQTGLLADLKAALEDGGRPRETVSSMKGNKSPQFNPSALAVNSAETTFQRLAREKAERNQSGKSRVTVDGKTVEINILLDACNRYRLDISTGICVCGFSKSDHTDMSKFKINAMLANENDVSVKNVRDFAKKLNLNNNAPVRKKSVKKILSSKRFQKKKW